MINDMRINNAVEVLYLALMHRWEKSAPPDRKQGILNGEHETNSQIARLAFVLKKVGASRKDCVFPILSRHTVRKDGRSYVSQDSSWMEQPYALWDGWFLEGCTSLEQKQWIVQQLTHAGLTATFVRCADDFVAGKSIESYFPTEDETREIIERSKLVEEQLLQKANE